MRSFHKKQKLFFTMLFVLEFFVTNVFPVFAFGPSIPSASSIMSDMEQRYHLDSSALQNLGEGMNVAGNKGPAPEVSLSFSPSDPKPGEKLTAKAFPMYFSNTEASMYYTWFLKRKGCDLTNKPTNKQKKDCNRNDDGEITVEDWKIEAAKIIAQNGYEGPPLPADPYDDDGYRARFGGDGKTNIKPYCYVHDFDSGTNYELSNEGSSSSFGCPPDSPNVHYSPKCLVAETGIGSSTTDPDTGVTSYTSSSTGSCSFSGLPVCGDDGETTCAIGIPNCVADSALSTACSGSGIIPIQQPTTFSCARGTKDPLCEHLFPFSYKESATGIVSNNTSSGEKKKNLKVGETGGSFGVDEERFWDTNPKDSSTADNGNKDEANVVGLGQSSFQWSYDSGDKVGVAVEGTSMTPTKHESASFMVMWAFLKKCPLSFAKATGDYVESIKGYNVSIPTAEFDLNKCIGYIPKKSNGSDDTPVESGLVDPTEGGQATKLSVSVTASPENLINDAGKDKSGDTVVVQAIVDNAAQSIANISFDWKVYIGSSISSFNSTTTSKDITDELRDLKLLGNTKGNALDSIRLKLDMPTDKSPYSTYLDSNKIGYLKFKVATQESFSGGGIRKGNGDDSVIVKFISSGDKITAYNVTPENDIVNKIMKVGLNGKICDNAPTTIPPLTPAEIEAYRLARTLCPVIKNQIIGLKVDGSGLSNFTWTINGSPLMCTARVSGSSCSLYAEEKVAHPSSTPPIEDKNLDAIAQGAINFFPVSGNPGDSYTVTVTANDVTSGKTVTLTRSFNVVEPKVVIKPVDDTIIWRKFLGQYKDISGSSACPGGFCDDLSESIYQMNSGSDLNFRAESIPRFLGSAPTSKWFLDNEEKMAESDGTIKVLASDPAGANKPAGGVYTISFFAQVVQSPEIRKALSDIWGISPFESPEINFSQAIQIEVQEVLMTEGPLSGPRKYYAAIASYIPASILFTFRIFLSVVLTLFALSFLNALLEERRIKAFTENFARSREK